MASAHEPSQLVIFGCGGHGRSIASTALSLGYEQIIFLDPCANENERLLGFPVVPCLPSDLAIGTKAIAAAGDAVMREAQRECIEAAGLSLVSLIAADAILDAHSALGLGVFVGRGAYVGPLSQIGDCAIVNTGAIVEHDSHVGSFTHISVGAIVAGRCQIGHRCFIGAGAVVIDKVVIGDDVVVGAGATVVDDLISSGTYIGTPARKIARRTR